MPLCEKCGTRFPNWLTLDGFRRNLSNRRYCLDCSPFGRHNTRQLAEPGTGGRPWQSLPAWRCSRCKQVKPAAEFYRRHDGRTSHGWCKACNLEHRQARSRSDRYAALFHYSGGDIKCACCGERTLEFLGLDHIDNDGAAHRRLLLGEGVHGGTTFYARLRLGGYTYPGLVVMCHNCNMARGFYGRCPHQAV